MATKENLGKGVETARERFSQLYQRFRTSPTEQALLPEALQQLSNSVEELTVTTEELRRQNDELASTRSLVEAEREHYKELFEFAPDGTQNLIQEASLADSEQQDLRIIEDEARRCRGIIRNLLDFARPTSHGPVAIAIETIVRECMNLVRAYLDKSNVNVHVHAPADLPQIYGDPQHLKQVFINLFFNAVDAMPMGGTLTVRAATEATAWGGHRQLTVAVSDTGFGISPEAIPNVFRPFFTTKKKRGTGLGLSV